MGRSISQIYSEALIKRNNYLQITELNSGRLNSKMSVLNIITYVVAAMIYTYETILDVFEVNISKLIDSRINGTAQYYATMAKMFQYNAMTQKGDELTYNEDTGKIEYKTIDKSHRIITHSAYQYYSDETGVVIKVCKDSGESGEGSVYTWLTDSELTAFKSYINEIKFIGADIQCLSIPGDLMNVVAQIVYDDLYITEEQAFDAVKKALIDYSKNLNYNGYIYYQSVIDAIQSVDHIVDVVGEGGTDHATITLCPCDRSGRRYSEVAQELYGRQTAYSGYITFVNELSDNESTLINGEGHLTFKAQSQNA